MPARRTLARGAGRPLSVAIELIIVAPRRGALAVALERATTSAGRERWRIPFAALQPEESLGDAAARLARRALGARPAFLDQVAALGGAARSSDSAQIGVAYLALVPETASMLSDDLTWKSLSEVPPLSARDREALERTLAALRTRVDEQPIAFRLLPAAFTLTELQGVYELLLGRRLHKASFRRSLHASALVEATNEWRSEGRGRPAQLFRYAAPRRKRPRRGIRFDLLS